MLPYIDTSKEDRKRAKKTKINVIFLKPALEFVLGLLKYCGFDSPSEEKFNEFVEKFDILKHVLLEPIPLLLYMGNYLYNVNAEEFTPENVVAYVTREVRY